MPGGYKLGSSSNLNEAAFLRSDTKTVIINHNTNKEYTYLTNLHLSPGDLVVVKNSVGLSIGTVKELHKTLKIKQDDPIKYAWVVQKLDLRPYDTLMMENASLIAYARQVRAWQKETPPEIKNGD